MYLLYVTLLYALQIWSVGGIGSIGFPNLKSLWPWGNVAPKTGFKKNVDLRFIRKLWIPEGVDIPMNEGVLDTYPGTPVEAFKIFKKSELYEFDAQPLDTAAELLTDQFGYDPNQESIFILHTISGDAENFFVRNTITALAMRNFIKHYNVFAFNMPELQASMEQTVARSTIGLSANFHGLAEAIGSFFDEVIQKNLLTTDKIHLIGFCYSTQLLGYIGRHIAKNNGQKIKSIFGLEPFAFGLAPLHMKLLSASDAQIVHVLHTNSGVFGTAARRGTADFVFNNGVSQPGCLFSLNMQCSHRRSVLLLWYLILYSDKFQARSCSNYIFFLLCMCQKKQVVTLTYPPNKEAKGRYSLFTSAYSPYGFGEFGANCHARFKASERITMINDHVFTKGKHF